LRRHRLRKTLLAMEFLVRGAAEFNEPGVFMSFEEKSEELTKNFVERKQRDIERKKAVIEAQITALRAGFEAEKDDLERAIAREKLHQEVLAEETLTMARTRKSDELPAPRENTIKTGKSGGK
jgi:KaiC/GvpD/RAD55 family RecA-like ATPase